MTAKREKPSTVDTERASEDDRGVDTAHELARIASALERIADALVPRHRRAPKRQTPDAPVSDIDRAAARRFARQLGLHVRGGKP